MKLKHDNVIVHTGYFRDEANNLSIAAALPLLSDLDTRLNDRKSKYLSESTSIKIISKIVEGLVYCHD